MYYYLKHLDPDPYHVQYIQTTYDFTGIFWLYYNEYQSYVVIKKGLVYADGITSSDLYYPEMRIPVSLSE